MASSPPESRVSVVIVNYQSYPELRACLTALDRGAPSTEIIVVDYETDDAQARAVEAAFPRVRVLRIARNEGFAAGVNRGARETSGPYLLLLNPDCIPESGLCDGRGCPRRGRVPSGGLPSRQARSCLASTRKLPA